ncbi:MAG TPA: hypothetical protein VD735_00260 [Candidatus Saccharimonadales bacterium]|nr:hypothetical protein [Candidatus Saccharimonadales bacterium]
MATVSKKRIGFLESEEGQEIQRQLQHMAADAGYNTTSSFSTNSTQYPDNQIPFVERHMQYLTAHPSLEPALYLNNIRLKTRIRR